MGVAYLDFRTSGALPAGMQPRAIGHYCDDLGDRERGALMLAKTDGKKTLRNLGRLGRLSQICIGLPLRSNPLADPRLEGLRRYAVAIAHDTDQAVQHEREQLVRLGFSERQIRTAALTAIRFRPMHTCGLWSLVCRAVTMAKQSLAAGVPTSFF